MPWFRVGRHKLFNFFAFLDAFPPRPSFEMGRGERGAPNLRPGGPTGQSWEQRQGKVRAYRKQDRPRVLHAYNQLDMNGTGALDRAGVRRLLECVVFHADVWAPSDSEEDSKVSEAALDYVTRYCRKKCAEADEAAEPAAAATPEAVVVRGVVVDREQQVSSSCTSCCVVAGSEAADDTPAFEEAKPVEYPKDILLEAVEKFRWFFKNEREIEAIYAAFDREHDDKLSREELRRMLQYQQDSLSNDDKPTVCGVMLTWKITDEDVEFVMAECDESKDGYIDKSEVLPAIATCQMLVDQHVVDAQKTCFCVIA